jgi:hypothetical protein
MNIKYETYYMCVNTRPGFIVGKYYKISRITHHKDGLFEDLVIHINDENDRIQSFGTLSKRKENIYEYFESKTRRISRCVRLIEEYLNENR